jgi:hypothetical protein
MVHNDKDEELIDGPLVSANAPTSMMNINISQEGFEICGNYTSMVDERNRQLVSAKTKFSTFIETEYAGEEQIMVLIGNQFLNMSPNGRINSEVEVLSGLKKPFKLYCPHVIRTSPNVRYLLINDQEIQKDYIFELRNDSGITQLILE